MNRNLIIEAYLFLRENNHSIPSSTIEFMKESSLKELDRIEVDQDCRNCRHDGNQSIFPSGCTGCGGYGEMINFAAKDGLYD